MLLQVVEILWELHLEIVNPGVRELPRVHYEAVPSPTYPRFRPGKGCSEATKQREHACAGCKHKRAFFTAAKHTETMPKSQKNNIYTIATMVAPESHTRGGSICYGNGERSTSQRAGAPF